MSSTTGQVVFLGALAGMAVGLVIAGVMSLDVIKETDMVANKMVKPAAPPPPGPPAPLRRLDELDRDSQKLFAFSPEEEQRVLRQVQQSMTSARTAAAAAAKGGA